MLKDQPIIPPTVILVSSLVLESHNARGSLNNVAMLRFIEGKANIVFMYAGIPSQEEDKLLSMCSVLGYEFKLKLTAPTLPELETLINDSMESIHITHFPQLPNIRRTRNFSYMPGTAFLFWLREAIQVYTDPENLANYLTQTFPYV